ncbi:AraC family transcriptional regulator [Rhizobium sp. R72]|uniref:helix-turn-helix domain-containing protein n=1 Tax=unclassified Rhizobium TaxID=2613769 RepID=UPI000B742256|nr:MULTISPECIES: helix-turn-helix domain-containing protein [unclassified Rhizobium]OWW05444.1 AraC family transcriptional regulator [Rhizobium sp. R72]OWW06501.1 AraC family transcriptional regulator [Rhizobium sp. R711]
MERRRFPREAKSQDEHPAPPPALRPLRFSTRDLDREQQFAAWQAYVAPLVDIRRPDGSAMGFAADHVAWNLGGILMVQQNTPAHSYMRSEAKVRSSPIDHWHVAVLRSGRTWTEVGGNVSEGEPGTVELRSLGHPFRGRSTDAETLSLYLPRELLHPASTGIKNNIALSGTRAKLLVDYLDGVEAKLAQLAQVDLPHVVQTIRDMILTWVSSSPAHHSSQETHSNLPLKERVYRFVQHNLTSSDLTTDRLCRELGISRTRLYQAFEADGGVHHYIQRRRLLSAHAALSDTSNRQQIVDIAFAAGFSSPAHFSRAFSKEFGYSPREARTVAMPSYLGYTVESAGQADGAQSFDKWLRTLGHSPRS